MSRPPSRPPIEGTSGRKQPAMSLLRITQATVPTHSAPFFRGGGAGRGRNVHDPASFSRSVVFQASERPP